MANIPELASLKVKVCKAEAEWEWDKFSSKIYGIHWGFVIVQHGMGFGFCQFSYLYLEYLKR